MAEYEDKLRTLLGKLFQFEHADLDFGIYRIMNQKRDDIKRFIDKDLMTIVDHSLAEFSSADRSRIESEIENLRDKIRSSIAEDAIKPNGDIKKEFAGTKLGKKYIEKLNQLANTRVSESTKAEIFNHVYRFFSRYYQDGDFISLRRRSKDSKYAIPYNGEEVFLYWANMDQYYIKTTEYFNNYAFEIQDYRVRFKVISAETAQNNNQSNKRFFVLANMEKPVVFDKKSKTLLIHFEYREITFKEEVSLGKRQDKINETMQQKILDAVSEKTLKNLLKKKEKDIPLLLKHLNTYTKRNTSDYFIHKDLEGFLKRELDFFIKNEVLDIDLLSNGKQKSIVVAKVKAIKEISENIIEFLAQIENFQKMLWEKKKFVTQTQYCITVGNIDERFYPQIATCEAQWKEWKELLHIDELEADIFSGNLKTKKGRIAFIREHPSLSIDTRYFERDFTYQLLKCFEDLDGMTDGLLIYSDNWQALNLLLEKYREMAKCIYIDPPYNTGNDGFLYKDQYQHSTWLSMMHSRLCLGRQFLSSTGNILVSIDDIEVVNLRRIMDFIFGTENFVDAIIWKKRYGGGAKEKHLVSLHEYVIFFTKDISQLEALFIPLSNESIQRYYKNKDRNFNVRGPYRTHPLEATKSVDVRPNLVFPIEAPDGSQVWPKRQWWWDKERVQKALKKSELEFIKTDDCWTVHTKQYLRDENGIQRKAKPFSIIDNVYTQHGASEIDDLFGDSRVYTFPKPSFLVEQLMQIAQLDEMDIVIDFFAGSAPTAQAVINLNRQDGGRRKAILVEIADYFDTVLLPRVKQVVFTPVWKNGKPQRKATQGEADRSPRIVKYIRLESYEDSLNNIEFTLPDGVTQKTLFEKKGYFLRYMLDFESRKSPCRLNVDKLSKPFEYTMRIVENGRIKENVAIDLVETFNYLLGLHVEKIRTFRDKGNKNWYYRVIFGHKDSEKIAIVWRNSDDLDLKKDRKFIDKTILKDVKIDKLYVNGQCFASGAISLEDKFKLAMGGV